MLAILTRRKGIMDSVKFLSRRGGRDPSRGGEIRSLYDNWRDADQDRNTREVHVLYFRKMEKFLFDDFCFLCKRGILSYLSLLMCMKNKIISSSIFINLTIFRYIVV